MLNPKTEFTRESLIRRRSTSSKADNKQLLRQTPINHRFSPALPGFFFALKKLTPKCHQTTPKHAPEFQKQQGESAYVITLVNISQMMVFYIDFLGKV
jgi:hypothetical protein